VERTSLTLAPEKLLEELTAMLGEDDPAGVVMAFDGDGTLWSGDVGEDLFRAATRDGFLLETPRAELLAEAEKYGVGLGAARDQDTNRIASALMAAYVDGAYPERETCAMMTWCYAGHRLAHVAELARVVIEEEQLDRRFHHELTPILEWARSAGLRCVLVSASPRVIVEPAGALRGFEPKNIAAATPAMDGDVILPRMLAEVPYAEHKLTAGRALFGDARWLAAFGDNVFDIDMLRTAELGIAVRPKPKLEAELAALGLRLLSRTP
jgi:phosphatidylglycerophosphatase C